MRFFFYLTRLQQCYNSFVKIVSNYTRILLIAIALSIGVTYVYAWTGPTATAPGGNTPAPINVGTAAQTKSGKLTVAGFSANTVTVGTTSNAASVTSPKFCLGTSCITEWPTAPACVPVGSYKWDVPGTYSWTAPAGVSSVKVTVVGGGAAGGPGQFCNDCHAMPGGGAGGAYVEKPLSVDSGTTYTIVVGRGGRGIGWQWCSFTQGESGGNSSFDTLVATGGQAPTGGTPGGGNGCGFQIYSTGPTCGGTNGTAYGAGGQGGGCYTSGGNGTDGAVIVSFGL